MLSDAELDEMEEQRFRALERDRRALNGLRRGHAQESDEQLAPQWASAQRYAAAHE